MKLYEVIVKQKDVASRIAVVDGNNKFTYNEMHLQSEALSKHIQGYVGSGRNIGLFFKRSAAYLVSYFAVLMSENKIVPLDEQLTSHEIDCIIDTCDLSMIITDASYIPIKIKSQVNILAISIDSNKPPVSNLLSEGPLREVDPDSAEACILLPSSGTTGMPKRVMHSQQSILLNARMHIHSLQLAEIDHTLVVLPLGFGYCNTAQIISHLLLGTTIVLYNGVITPGAFFAQCEQREITCVIVVPSLLRSIVQSKLQRKYDLTRLKYVIVGGSKLTENMVNKFNKKFPQECRLVQTYGLTEAGPRVTTKIMEKHEVSSPNSVGSPLSNIDICIETTEGSAAAAKEVGEILIHTPSRMIGYYSQSDSTKDILTVDKYLRTGDLGYLDEKGELFIVGRKKNLIIKGGKKISPEEIEDILLLYPKIREVRVYGESCENGEEHIHAEVVMDKGGIIDEYELKKHCEAYISSYKLPQTYHFVPFINRTYNGKIYRGSRP